MHLITTYYLILPGFTKIAARTGLFPAIQHLVIKIERREDVRLIEELATRLGLSFFKLSDAEDRLLARKALVATMSDVDPDTDVPEDLILETIEEIRTKHYEEGRDQSGS